MTFLEKCYKTYIDTLELTSHPRFYKFSSFKQWRETDKGMESLMNDSNAKLKKQFITESLICFVVVSYIC